MNQSIKLFIDELKKYLEGLPVEEIQRVVGYYEEYLSDSLDAGNNPEDVLKELGSPDKIAETIRKEINIKRAESNPGIINFSRVIKDAFKSVSTPVSVFSLSITTLLSFGMIALIFGAAVVCGTGAAAAILLCIYEAFTIPFNFILEILGTLGMGVMTAGILFVATLCLWGWGKLFIKLSTKQIGLMLKLSGKTAAKPEKHGSKRLWPVVRLFLILSAAGFVLFVVSGLPWRFFTIFNSMKIEGNINKTVTEYNIQDIRKISVLTAHSAVRIEESSSDKIVVSYEEPDWLTHQISSSGGVLDFREKSNGRFPLFELVSLHASQSELIISLPKGFNADSITLQSTGGKIFISDINENLDVTTLTGNIKYNRGTSENSIIARTKSGKILVDGVQNGKRANGWTEYNSGVNMNNKIKLTSTAGSITIEK